MQFIFSYNADNMKGIPMIFHQKPGPKPRQCRWCKETKCHHCQCPGYSRCDHSNGVPCTRSR